MDITQIWGNKEVIGPLGIAARSVVMFAYMIFLLRITGMRPFGKGDAFDSVLTILFGAVLARGIVGATPFVSAMVSGAVLVALHFFCAKLTFFSRKAGKILKGKPHLLYKDGQFEKENMQKVCITEEDMVEELRITVQEKDLTKMKEVYSERTGKVSFVKKT